MMRKAAVLASFLTLQPAWAVTYDGTVQWSRKVSLGPPVSGIVSRVNITAGAVVKKDEVLLALDPVPFQANVAQAQAALKRAKISRDEANRDLKQADELYARTVLSTTELENARMKQGRADAAVMEAQAALTRAEYELRVSQVRAPYEATVLSIQAQPGQAVVAGLEPPSLVTVSARGEYVVAAAVPAAAVVKLQSGQKAAVHVGEKRFEGKIKTIGIEPVQNVRKTSYEVQVVFNAGDTQLRAGLPARVELP